MHRLSFDEEYIINVILPSVTKIIDPTFDIYLIICTESNFHLCKYLYIISRDLWAINTFYDCHLVKLFFKYGCQTGLVR